jgi:prepilin-type N-terminal cleavage/methylation domain-containing protein
VLLIRSIYPTDCKRDMSKAGFTLIELLVAIAIMMLILGASLVSYLRFNDRQGVIAAGDELRTMVRNAQTRARIGDKPSGCDKLLSYRVRVPAQSNIATMTAECESGSVTRSEITLSSGARASTLINVEFLVLHGGVVNPGTLTLESPQGLVYSFAITAGGEVGGGAIQQ